MRRTEGECKSHVPTPSRTSAVARKATDPTERYRMSRSTTRPGARRRHLGAAAVATAGVLVAGLAAGAPAPPDSSPAATAAAGSIPAAAFDQSLFGMLPASIQDSKT